MERKITTIQKTARATQAEQNLQKEKMLIRCRGLTTVTNQAWWDGGGNQKSKHEKTPRLG